MKKRGIFQKDSDQVEETAVAPQEAEKEKGIFEAASEDDETTGELALDVYQDANNIYVVSMMAGVKAEDIDIGINGDMLTIRGSRGRKTETKEDDFFYQECYWGSFSRSVILPVEVEVDRVAADLKDGILTVRLPKSKKSKARKIAVRMSE